MEGTWKAVFYDLKTKKFEYDPKYIMYSLINDKRLTQQL